MTDLTLPAAQPLVFSFAVTAPGSVALHAFSSSTSAYDPSNLRACLQAGGQPSCSPAPFPNPAYWTISADDLNHTHSYQLRVVAVAGSSALLGLSVGWNGTHQMDVGGLDLPGGCSGSTGYTPGCGMKFKFTPGADGSATVGVSMGGLHLSVTDKTSGTKVFSGVVNGSATVSVTGGHEYEGRLYPESGGPVTGVRLHWTWP